MLLDTPFDELVVFGVTVLLLAGPEIKRMARGKGRPGDPRPPTHPLPVTSPIETSRGAGDPDKPLSWFFRPGRPK